MKASSNPDASVLLSWQPLSLTEAKGFPLYIVSYKSVDGSSRGSVNTTNSSVVITDINPMVGCIILIQVSTENGKNKGDIESSKDLLSSIDNVHLLSWHEINLHYLHYFPYLFSLVECSCK